MDYIWPSALLAIIGNYPHSLISSFHTLSMALLSLNTNSLLFRPIVQCSAGEDLFILRGHLRELFVADILQDLVDVVTPLDDLLGRALLLQVRLVYHSPGCRMPGGSSSYYPREAG